MVPTDDHGEGKARRSLSLLSIFGERKVAATLPLGRDESVSLVPDSRVTSFPLAVSEPIFAAVRKSSGTFSSSDHKSQRRIADVR